MERGTRGKEVGERRGNGEIGRVKICQVQVLITSMIVQISMQVLLNKFPELDRKFLFLCCNKLNTHGSLFNCILRFTQ